MFDPDYDLFLDIIESGSISAAARQRNMSTAALSKRLARLEERLSVRLMHRTTRRLALTREGQSFQSLLLPLRTSLLAAEEQISGKDTLVRGPLRVTVPTSFGRMHIAPCVPQFLSEHPDVKLSLDFSDEYADLLDGSCDLAIRIGERIGPGLIGHRLGSSHRVLCAAPSYLAAFGEPLKLQDLKHHRLLAAANQLPWSLDGPDGIVRQQGRSYVLTNSSEVVRELALGGCGIALRSLWDVGEELRRGVLQRVLPNYQGSHNVGIYAVHAPSPAVPARVSSFITAMAQHLQKTTAFN